MASVFTRKLQNKSWLWFLAIAIQMAICVAAIASCRHYFNWRSSWTGIGYIANSGRIRLIEKIHFMRQGIIVASLITENETAAFETILRNVPAQAINPQWGGNRFDADIVTNQGKVQTQIYFSTDGNVLSMAVYRPELRFAIAEPLVIVRRIPSNLPPELLLKLEDLTETKQSL